VRLGIAHSLENDPFCRPQSHGHVWTVTLEFGSDDRRFAEGLPGAPRIQARLAFKAVIAEYIGRDLNLMIGAGEPTVAGLAAVLAERLSMQIPTIQRLEVIDTDDGFGEIIRYPS
jgi:hypothetical protein